LTTLYGAQSSEIEELLEGPANIWSIGGSVLGPLFQGGRLYYSYQGSIASWEEAKLIYEQTVLNALAEVSNALVARQKYAASRLELERQVVALQDSVRLSTLRFNGGLANYYEVLEAQQQLFPAENALARNQLSQLTTVVELYRALGGGWRSEELKRPEHYPLRRDPLDAIIPGSHEGAS
jgi:multidrug efflux system outer membrane protein